MPTRFIATLIVFAAACGEPPTERPGQTSSAETTGVGGPACEDGPGEVFERRIRPLLEQDRPSSCSKCHAAGVNLAAFVTGDACSSMACLVAGGMVDLEHPRESMLLEFIDRGYDPKPNTGVTDVMVANEYTGFLEWIQWSAACPEQCPAPEGSSQCTVPETPLAEAPEEEPEPDPVIYPPLNTEGYPCTEPDQVQAFLDYAFPPESRCGHCHAEDGAIAGVGGAPTWIDHARTFEGARRTIRNLYALGGINLDVPSKSRVLLKPLNTDAGGIEHGGGGKFQDKTDELYVDLLQWITMQAECDLTQGVTPHPEWPSDKLHEKYPELPYVE